MKVFRKIVLRIVFPFLIWEITGKLLLNFLLAHGLPYNFNLILGYGGGLAVYLFVWNILLLLDRNKNGITELENNDGCLMMIGVGTLALIVAGLVYVAKGESRRILDSIFPPRVSVNNNVISAASQLCSKGTPIQEATSYASSDLTESLHPIVLANEAGGWNIWTNDLPISWQPRSVQNIQLVACVGAKKVVVLRTCEFSGGATLEMDYQTLDIRLLEAKTGVLIRTVRVSSQGNFLSGCPDSIQVGSLGEHKKDISEINKTQIIDALSQYVENK
jgi:hypothetical protein